MGVLWAASTLNAQSKDVGSAGEMYVVKDGDTLEDLAARFLGSDERWAEIWRVNPGINDPHWVFPGQQILIPKNRALAQIVQISRRVDARPHPAPTWSLAHVGDGLNRRDGLRTYRSSSAQLGFTDGSELTIGEESLIFVRDSVAPAVKVSRKSIEIVEGQGDLTLPATGSSSLARADIEVVVGSARVNTTRAADGSAWSRARQDASGGPAQLMVFRGSTEVTSAGGKVTLGEGMGTSVAKGQKPLLPEPLLPAPVVTIPSSGAGFDYANPRFVWRPVSGAVSYVVEVCADAACSRLVVRAPGLAQNEWVAEGLPLGVFYWRVTARSRNSLDGYPSAARQITVLSLWRRPDGARVTGL